MTSIGSGMLDKNGRFPALTPRHTYTNNGHHNIIYVNKRINDL